MGFFDKVKTFAGGSSMVTVDFIDIERQAPAGATFPIGDSVLKGRYRITAQKDCTVLKHVAQLRTRWPEKDGTLGVVVAEQIEDPAYLKNATGWKYSLPYDLKVGQTQDSSFLIHDINLRGFIQQRYGVAALTPQIQCFVKIIVDVKGSPFDPEFESILNVV